MQPLEYDPTAALAYQLDKSPLYAMEIAALLRAGVFAQQHAARPDSRRSVYAAPIPPRLRSRWCWCTARLSSPVRWAELVNELEGIRASANDSRSGSFSTTPATRLRYSAGRLRAALTATLQELDPEGKDPALRRMVVIGHSQGASDEVNRHRQRDAILGPHQQQSRSMPSRSTPRPALSCNSPCLLHASSLCREGSVRGDASPRGVTRHWPGWARLAAWLVTLPVAAVRPARPGRHDDR